VYFFIVFSPPSDSYQNLSISLGESPRLPFSRAAAFFAGLVVAPPFAASKVEKFSKYSLPHYAKTCSRTFQNIRSRWGHVDNGGHRWRRLRGRATFGWREWFKLGVCESL